MGVIVSKSISRDEVTSKLRTVERIIGKILPAGFEIKPGTYSSAVRHKDGSCESTASSISVSAPDNKKAVEIRVYSSPTCKVIYRDPRHHQLAEQIAAEIRKE